MTITPFGLGGTRYGVRVGSMGNSDAGNTANGFALGQAANWGQGVSPYYDNMTWRLQTGYAGGSPDTVGGWTAMPYLRPCSPFLFDVGAAYKMQSPQDVLLPRAQAVDTSRAHAHSAFYGLGSYGAVGATLAPNQYSVTVNSMMIDVECECMLAGIDRNKYQATLQDSDNIATAVAGPAGLDDSAYSIVGIWNPGPWVTAAEMFANPGLYCYLGARDDADNVLGVMAYVNSSLSRLSYSFSVGAGLTRSFALVCPWSVEFNAQAINSWYGGGVDSSNGSPRFRLTTPGLQLANTYFSSQKDYNYAVPAHNNSLTTLTGGEFMAQYYGAPQGSRYFWTSANSAGAPGAQMIWQAPAAGTPGGWGFIAPPNNTILGTPVGGAAVYLPSMSVGRDCYLDIAHYSINNGAWNWASASVPFSDGATTPPNGMQAFSPDANWPGGLARIQNFSIQASSRSQMVEEMGNRAAVGVVAQPPTTSGTFSILETDVYGLETVLYAPVQPILAYTGTAVGAGSAAAPVVAADGNPVLQLGVTDVLGMYDFNAPMRVNMVLTVASPGSAHVAILRFAVPNVRISGSSRRVMVNGVAARQYSFVCEDGGVASAHALDGTGGWAAQGNLALNGTAPPESYGLKLGSAGGNTGGLAMQSFYVPAL